MFTVSNTNILPKSILKTYSSNKISQCTKKKTAAFYQFTNQIAMKNKNKNSKLHKLI